MKLGFSKQIPWAGGLKVGVPQAPRALLFPRGCPFHGSSSSPGLAGYVLPRALSHIPPVTVDTKKLKLKPHMGPVTILLVSQEHKHGVRFLGRVFHAPFEGDDPEGEDNVPI